MIGGERSSDPGISGPLPMRVTDIDAVNRVFSDAFTERYRKDGMAGVRVPNLHPAIWRFAIESAGDGAMIWRDVFGGVAAFNVAHVSGIEGWMGPLAVRPDWQGRGLGKQIVRSGAAWLAQRGAAVIGLETMPRTMENIGFYAGLGFVPGPLTITVTIEAASGLQQALSVGAIAGEARREMLQACDELTHRVMPGYRFTREIELTLALSLGDVLLIVNGGVLRGFALYHAVPLVEGRPREELRVLKLVLASEEDIPQMMDALADAAWRNGTRRAAVRVQADYGGAFQQFVTRGARVRWTDLRMSLASAPDRRPTTGLLFSNWEI